MNDEDRLEEFLNQWEDARDEGRILSPEQICAEFPHLVKPLRQRIWLLYPNCNLPDVESADEPVAEIRAGRYRTVRLLARGGISEVFVAHDDEVGREVALKRLQTDRDWDPQARARFRIEADVTSRLDHPGVVPLYGIVEDARKRSYFAMRLLPDRNLDQAIAAYYSKSSAASSAEHGSVDFNNLLRAFLSVCHVVAYAHSRNVLHRDIKPANILLGEYGEVLLIDWGLAKVQSDSGEQSAEVVPTTDQPSTEKAQSPLTSSHSGTVMGVEIGTPGYMSPEQAKGEWNNVGPCSDVFSLGATLYKLLTGLSPNPRRSSSHTTISGNSVELPRPRSVNSKLPRALEAICLRAMSKDPASRYPTAKALAEDLERWFADRPVTAWKEPWTIRLRRWVKQHRTFVAAFISTTVVAIGLLIAFVVKLNVENAKLEVAKNKAVAAQREAETNLGMAGEQLMELASLFNNPDIASMDLKSSAFIQLLQKHSEQIRRLAAIAPANEFGDSIRLLHDSSQLTQLAISFGTPPKSSEIAALCAEIDRIRNHLRQNSVAQRPPSDRFRQTLDYELARSDFLEGMLVMLTADKQKSQRLLESAFEKYERVSNANSSVGVISVLGGSNTASTIIETFLKTSPDRLSMVRGWARRTSAMIDRLEKSSEEISQIPDPDAVRYWMNLERVRFFRSVAIVCAIEAQDVKKSDFVDELKSSAAFVFQAVQACPEKYRSNPEFLKCEAEVRKALGLIALQRQDHQEAWNQLHNAKTLFEKYGSFSNDSSGKLSNLELMAETGISILQAALLEPKNTADLQRRRKELVSISADVAKALESLQSAQSSLPFYQRNPKLSRSIKRWQSQLKDLDKQRATIPVE